MNLNQYFKKKKCVSSSPPPYLRLHFLAFEHSIQHNGYDVRLQQSYVNYFFIKVISLLNFIRVGQISIIESTTL